LPDSEIFRSPAPPVATLGVIADTHIPDRIRKLPSRVLEIFQTAGVTGILHAGDICIPTVLEDLSQVAPVTAVRGNRDWLFRTVLPPKTTLVLFGVTLGLTHGHGGWANYFRDKMRYVALGYRFDHYYQILRRDFPDSQVIVYGHTHRAENRRINGQLIFNPGSACCPIGIRHPPSIGLLHFYPGQQVIGQIIKI